MKIAIIGNPETIKGFKSLGIDLLGVRNKEEAEKSFLSVYSSDEYALLLLTEDWFTELRDQIKEFEEKPLPALMMIPGIGSKKSIAEQELRQMIERAVGSDIFSEK
ncbi:MAG: hypothetical protein KY054_00640 [Candidatus Nealsonbacteria bacterium]|nr:hypothetical protein [Candidatus Nealsonbacteria bacterium]